MHAEATNGRWFPAFCGLARLAVMGPKAAETPPNPRHPSLRWILGASACGVAWGLLVSPVLTKVPLSAVVGRTSFVAAIAALIFLFLERAPARLPRGVARWAVQAAGVGLSVPVSVAAMYVFLTRNDPLAFFDSFERLFGAGVLCASGMLIGPWVATAAALLANRDREIAREKQSSARERDVLSRDARLARLELLKAQVQPHFLFNTLANVRELLETNPKESISLLHSLIEYLRAAVPTLGQSSHSIADELALARAYLEIMRARFPDRLTFEIDSGAGSASDAQCPPGSLMVLVENAVTHGIGASLEGGHIEVAVREKDGRCSVVVADSGVGLGASSGPRLGTGLAGLQERLRLTFEGDAIVSVAPRHPIGTVACLEFPMRQAL